MVLCIKVIAPLNLISGCVNFYSNNCNQPPSRTGDPSFTSLWRNFAPTFNGRISFFEHVVPTVSYKGWSQDLRFRSSQILNAWNCSKRKDKPVLNSTVPAPPELWCPQECLLDFLGIIPSRQRVGTKDKRGRQPLRAPSHITQEGGTFLTFGIHLRHNVGKCV